MPWSGYFARSDRNLQDIIEFIRPLDPDLIGLVEVDAGSYRSGKANQAEILANQLGHYHCYRSKYAENGSITRRIPVLNKQGNAFVVKDTITRETFHYFQKGMKRLVIELEFDNLVVFLVHLALGFRVRHHQLQDLYNLVKEAKKPCVVAGDFNALWGENEIELFLAASGLINPNKNGAPTFPSWSPNRHLDFILHSPEITAKSFSIPQVQYSDHLPLLFDFELPNGI